MTNASEPNAGGAVHLKVVVPSYNRWHEARVALQCLMRSEYQDFEVVLVEDGCTDGTPENCRREFPSVRLLHGDGNLWWSGAINMGVEYALKNGADVVVWLNDDNRVEPSTLGALVESFRRQGGRSIVCARVRATDTGAEWTGAPPPWHPEFGAWQPPSLEDAPEVQVYHPPGGQGVLIPAECFREVGVIDARAFPHYWADHDFHYRAMKAGFRYFISTRAVVNNVAPPEPEEITSAREAFDFLFGRRSPMNVATVRRLLKRHLPPREYRAIFYPMLRRHLLWLAYGLAKNRPALRRSLRTIRKSLPTGRRAA
ncbi:MAG TPA: glycosyltransferase family 2 protein [Pyrinomonadaceae bacterium]|nr:glycosyltransferase family 2 protein [Pyrinomonadaceae bacterium]